MPTAQHGSEASWTPLSIQFMRSSNFLSKKVDVQTSPAAGRGRAAVAVLLNRHRTYSAGHQKARQTSVQLRSPQQVWMHATAFPLTPMRNSEAGLFSALCAMS